MYTCNSQFEMLRMNGEDLLKSCRKMKALAIYVHIKWRRPDFFKLKLQVCNQDSILLLLSYFLLIKLKSEFAQSLH